MQCALSVFPPEGRASPASVEGLEGAPLGEAHREGGALPRRRFDFERRAVAAHGVLDDGEPEARPAHAAAAALVDAVEALGESRDVLGIDPDPGVLDGQDGARAHPLPGDRHRAAFGRVADRVRDEVHDGASEFVRVPDHAHVFDLAGDLVAPHRERPPFADDVLDQLGHRDHFGLFGRRPLVLVLQLREREEVVQDALHAARLLAHERTVVFDHLLRNRPLFALHVEEPADHGQGRAELMAHVRDEVAAQPQPICRSAQRSPMTQPPVSASSGRCRSRTATEKSSSRPAARATFPSPRRQRSQPRCSETASCGCMTSA